MDSAFEFTGLSVLPAVGGLDWAANSRFVVCDASAHGYLGSTRALMLMRLRYLPTSARPTFVLRL
jgi:hypothetical protein